MALGAARYRRGYLPHDGTRGSVANPIADNQNSGKTCP
jgi:hypothetical protein